MNWYLKVLKNYAVFEGRSRRKEYWYFSLFYILFAFLIAFITRISGIQFLYPIYMLASIIPALAVSVRRMHDINKSGWFILIPIYNIILYCTNGTVGPNQYGSDPKRPEFEEFLNDPESVQPQQDFHYSGGIPEKVLRIIQHNLNFMLDYTFLIPVHS